MNNLYFNYLKLIYMILRIIINGNKFIIMCISLNLIIKINIIFQCEKEGLD